MTLGELLETSLCDERCASWWATSCAGAPELKTNSRVEVKTHLLHFAVVLLPEI